jgi:hypothetical protein
MKLTLTIALSTLMLSAPAFAATVPEGVTLRAYQPVGNGDPNAISCWARRVSPPIRGLQCARNSVWARINASSPSFDAGQPNSAPNNGMGFSAVPNAGQHTPLP